MENDKVGRFWGDTVYTLNLSSDADLLYA